MFFSLFIPYYISTSVSFCGSVVPFRDSVTQPALRSVPPAPQDQPANKIPLAPCHRKLILPVLVIQPVRKVCRHRPLHVFSGYYCSGTGAGKDTAQSVPVSVLQGSGLPPHCGYSLHLLVQILFLFGRGVQQIIELIHTADMDIDQNRSVLLCLYRCPGRCRDIHSLPSFARIPAVTT